MNCHMAMQAELHKFIQKYDLGVVWIVAWSLYFDGQVDQQMKRGHPGSWKCKAGRRNWLFEAISRRKVLTSMKFFSPIVHHTSIRVLFAFVALIDLQFEQLDGKTTFLHEDLKEEIYMRQSEGFIVPGKQNHVPCLKKSYIVWNKCRDNGTKRLMPLC